MVSTLILSAGLGTRLAPLTSWRPKPLVPIGDRPAVAAIVSRVAAVSRVVVLNAHHRADDIERYARSAGLLLSREEELLGTAGGLAHAAELLGGGDVLVWNGDMDGELDPTALLGAYAGDRAGGAVATLAVKPRADAAGNVGLDGSGSVVRIRRETAREGEAASADFLGIYVVGEALRRSLPPSGDIIAECFLPALRRGDRIAAFVCEVPFFDIGTPRAYLDANLRWLAARGASSWVEASAQVDAEVTLDRVLVGAGARVIGHGAIERCVVWPGARVVAPLADTVVAAEGTVSVERPAQ